MNKDYSVVIGLYNGYEWLDKIILSIENQTIKPKKIIVWINNNENKLFYYEKYKYEKQEIQFIQTNKNEGVYSRFTASLLCDTNRILVLDDDTIPGSKWIENCYNTIDYVGENSIIGYRGIRLKSDALYDVEAYEKGTTETTEVDLCGHAWFVTRKQVLAMFEDIPVNYFNGEDTHISAINQIKFGTKTYIPKQLISDPQTWGSTMQHLGAQAGRLSTSLGPVEHFNQRKQVNEAWIRKGWKPLYARASNNGLS